MAGETGGAWVRIRVRIESTSEFLDEPPSKPSVSVRGFSSKFDSSGVGRLVIANFIVNVKVISGISSDDIDAEQSYLVELLQLAVQAAAGRVWTTILDELVEEESPSRPGRPPSRVTGELFESIRIETDGDGLGAFIGSGLDYAAYLEFGTMDMPARPFLIPALERNKRVIEGIIKLAALAAVGVRGPSTAERNLRQGLGEYKIYNDTIVRNFVSSKRSIKESQPNLLGMVLDDLILESDSLFFELFK